MAQPTTMPTIQYMTAADIMVCVGVGRSKAYEIIKNLNDELERDGFLTFPGKVPERKLRERLYLPENIRTTAKNGGTKQRR